MEIEVVSPIEAEAEVQRYTLVSDDIYVRRYDSSTIPDWYRSLIENLIAQDPTITDVNAALDYLTSVDNGYAVKFANLDTWQASTNALLSTLGSNLDGNTAAIADIQTTYATKTEASAIATTAVQSYIDGGHANAWFTSQVSTYASETSANSASISTLSAALDGQSVVIEDISNVSIDGSGYMLGAARIGTAPDGSITGWQFMDGTNVQSTFKIMADKFQVSNSTTGYTPFSIVGTDIVFNGKVSFNSVTDVPQLGSTPQEVVDAVNAGSTTTINGSKITTGSITANQIAAGSITADKIQSVYINGYTIEGAVIKGASIEGSVIKSSWIDYTTTGDLTNWQHFTPATVPAQYINHFAKDNTTGELIVDSLGYVRLAGVRVVYALGQPVTRYYTSSIVLENPSVVATPYNNYIDNNPASRLITQNVFITIAATTLFYTSTIIQVAQTFYFTILLDNYVAAFNAGHGWTLYRNGNAVLSSVAEQPSTYTYNGFSITLERDIISSQKQSSSVKLAAVSRLPMTFSGSELHVIKNVSAVGNSTSGSTYIGYPDVKIESY